MVIPTKKLCSLVLSIAFMFLSFFAVAQKDTAVKSNLPFGSLGDKIAEAKKDTVKKINQTHSPKKATLLSAVLPGSGQIYNKKYWKLPIIYGALGTSVYLAYKQQDSVRNIVKDLDYRFDKDSTTSSFYQKYSDEQMLIAYDATLKKRDLFFIVSIALYALQVVDANVDAHLFYFDVSDDLSLNLIPEFNSIAYAPRGSYSTGVKLTLKLK